MDVNSPVLPMEKLQSEKIPFSCFFVLAILISSLLLPSSAYNLPDRYFINCGSDSSVQFANRLFMGDQFFFAGPSSTVNDSSQSARKSLYQTARIFHGHSGGTYQFEINDRGTYLLRLHFLAFSSPAHLSGAVFDVWGYGFSLLSNFTVPQGKSLPVIKEFFVTINLGTFTVYFTPSRGSSLAFVNAIEVFLSPESFIPDHTSYISSEGSKGNYGALLFQALHTVYRINVGGSNIKADEDTLLRTWIPDDNFLTHPEAATNTPLFEDWIIYQSDLATKYIAPDSVYRTAKELKTDQRSNHSPSNISWGFNVSKNSSYLLRMHFCDIISQLADLFVFNIYIYGNFSHKISPHNITHLVGSPFYIDFVVDTDNSGFLNISVGRLPESQTQNAILNGLEIMLVMNKSGSDPIMQSKPKKISLSIMVGSIVGGALLLISMVALIVSQKYWRLKSDEVLKVPDSLLLLEESSPRSQPLKISYTEIKRATKNFSPELVIGKGGFGSVYQGTLRNGMKVAVKRHERGRHQGSKEFLAEVNILSQIRHPNLVSLIGYCRERSEMILVYEFMEKGNLADHLYVLDSDSKNFSSLSQLSWEQRLQICIDAAEALNYLHTGCASRIVHRDVKTSSIMLGENYVVKVGDFGLSKFGPFDQGQYTTSIKGTFGYLDPDYFRTLRLTEKSDVYSFGVVLLEVLCARPATLIATDQEEERNLANWGMLWKKKGELEKIIDPILVANMNSSSLRKFGETVEKCLSENGDERPVMREVLWNLELVLGYQQTGANRELHEDRMVKASQIESQVVQHYASCSYQVGEGDSSE